MFARGFISSEVEKHSCRLALWGARVLRLRPALQVLCDLHASAMCMLGSEYA